MFPFLRGAGGKLEIVNFLNDKGVRNMLGGKMTHSSVNTMLKNRRYIGELSFRDIVVPDAIPVIVPKDLFDRVQKRLDKNKRALPVARQTRNICIRAGEKCSSGQFLLYNVVQCGILNATTQNLYIKENIDETVFMFALFKCRKSDKGRN